MAKKTVKKQPLKAAAKTATKTADKNAKKTVKKAAEPVKAKASKAVPKKEEKPAKAAKAVPAPAVKKVEEKKAKEVKMVPAPAVEKVKAKAKVPKTVEADVTTNEPDAHANGADVKEVEVAVVEKPKKKTAAQKKKEKLDIDSNAKWADLHEKYKQIKPVNYSMKDAFEANQPIQHKVLGWGWVISSENDRLEVLFKDGKKILISNYKA